MDARNTYMRGIADLSPNFSSVFSFVSRETEDVGWKVLERHEAQELHVIAYKASVSEAPKVEYWQFRFLLGRC